MGQAKETKGGKGYLGILQSFVRIFSAICTVTVAWVILSYFLIPRFSHDICITDSRMESPETLDAIKEVLAVFNNHNVRLQLGCDNSLTSIQLYYAKIQEPQILAQTWAHFFPLDLFSKTGSYEYEINEIFIPTIRIIYTPVPIQFNEKILNEKNTIGYSRLKFQLILIHEIGHALGAPHVFYDEKHIMYPYIYIGDQTLDHAVLQVKEITYWIQRYK